MYKPIHVRYASLKRSAMGREKMIERLVQRLFRRVYYPITAVISMDEKEKVLDLVLLDSLFADPQDSVVAGAKAVHVVVNHPDGSMEWTQEERTLVREIERQAGEGAFHVYLYGEDIGLIRVDRLRILRYNDENAV